MRVTFIEQEAQLGGVEYTTLRVAQALDKSKYMPVIICPVEGDLPRLARQAGLTVRIIPHPEFSSVSFFWNERYVANPFGFLLTACNVFQAMLNLQRDLRENPTDIIITKGLLAHFYGGWAAHNLHIPCIWYVQEEVDAKRSAGLYRSILNWGAQKIPARVIVDATALIEQFGNTGKVQGAPQVIYNGIDTEQFAPFSLQERQKSRQDLNIPANATVVGQASRIVPLKGQAILLQAFACLALDFPDLHLLFVGAPLFGSQGYEQKLRSQSARWGLADRVHFSGFIPDVRQGLAAMDIFVHASVETDSPVSVLEAMSCGLPMVVSGVRGTTEMVTPGINALVFPPGDADALAAALVHLLKNQSLQSNMGQQARQTAMQKFSLKTSITKLEDLIEDVYTA